MKQEKLLKNEKNLYKFFIIFYNSLVDKGVFMKMKYCKTFMKTALLWAENSYAIRRKVGAVLADKTNTRVLACGYNGTLSGLPNTCEREVIVDGVRELKTLPGYVMQSQTLLSLQLKMVYLLRIVFFM